MKKINLTLTAIVLITGVSSIFATTHFAGDFKPQPPLARSHKPTRPLEMTTTEEMTKAQGSGQPTVRKVDTRTTIISVGKDGRTRETFQQPQPAKKRAATEGMVLLKEQQ